jgi:DNA integrity scanning protein DisA with diadenylate cyclase activity
VISNYGVAVSAARYINVLSNEVPLQLGLGSRHVAAASITLQTGAVAVVVSESSIVRVFDEGRIVSEILPELWMLRQHGLKIDFPRVQERVDEGIIVRTRADS